MEANEKSRKEPVQQPRRTARCASHGGVDPQARCARRSSHQHAAEFPDRSRDKIQGPGRIGPARI